MQWIMWLIAIFLTYYTFRYSLYVWKEGNKLGSSFTMLLAACFIPLVVWLKTF